MIKRNKEHASDNFNLLDRDVPEKIWLWRHRQQPDAGTKRGRRAGSMSQSEAAEYIGLSSNQLVNLERGGAVSLNAKDLNGLFTWEGWEELDDEPTTAELCFLARRRSGMELKEIATAIGVSKTTYVKLELEGDNSVRDFWIKKGYKFGIKRPAR